MMRLFEEYMKKIIHVHQNRIRANLKYDKDDAPIIVRTYKGVEYGNDVALMDENGNILARI